MMKVTTLIENNKALGMGKLVAEHGLSMHIEHAGKKILFDTGESGAFADNAAQLGIAIDQVNMAVISHHHYDHAGGLRRFLELNKTAKIYLLNRPNGEPYGKFLWMKKYIGLDEKLIAENSERFVFLGEDQEISPDVFILTHIGRDFPIPKGNRSILIKSAEGLEPDKFTHELVMVLKETDGLVMFTGCGHQGILNMITSVEKSFPDTLIKAVFGGFHLMALPPFNFMSGTKADVQDLGQKILQRVPGHIFTGHCTGSHAFPILKQVMGDRLDSISTGHTVAV